MDGSGDLPRLIGWGPATASTSQALTPYPEVIWDTNRYYYDLQVHGRANKRELREAYQRLEGWKSIRLTYVFSQLLDDKIRRAYDATPLGQLFFDLYVESWIRRIKAREGSEHLRRGGRYEDIHPIIIDPDGNPEEEEYFSHLGDEVFSHDEDSDSVGRNWPFAYYLWWSESGDLNRLKVWQEQVIAAIANNRSIMHIAVGFHGGYQAPWLLKRVGYRIVAFLSEEVQPTSAMANDLANRVEVEYGQYVQKAGEY